LGPRAKIGSVLFGITVLGLVVTRSAKASLAKASRTTVSHGLRRIHGSSAVLMVKVKELRNENGLSVGYELYI